MVTSSQYWTPPIAAGASLAVTVDASIPAGAAEAYSQADVLLYLADTGTMVGSQVLAVNMPAAKIPTTAHDVTVKNGSQAVGGSVLEYSASPALASGKSAKFTIALRNGGTAPETETLAASLSAIGCGSGAFTVTIKAGSQDVTAAALAGTYTSAAVQPGKSVVLTETVKYSGDPSCLALYTVLQDGSTVQYSQVPIAAS